MKGDRLGFLRPVSCPQCVIDDMIRRLTASLWMDWSLLLFVFLLLILLLSLPPPVLAAAPPFFICQCRIWPSPTDTRLFIGLFMIIWIFQLKFSMTCSCQCHANPPVCLSYHVSLWLLVKLRPLNGLMNNSQLYNFTFLCVTNHLTTRTIRNYVLPLLFGWTEHLWTCPNCSDFTVI